MKIDPKRALSRLSVLTAALLLSPFAFAASTWDLSGNSGSGCTQNSTNSGNYGNSWSCSSSNGGPVATGTAWSTTGSGASFAAANLAQYTGNGFGVQNTVEGLNASSPNHSLDNGGNTDVLELAFATSVALSSISLGWSYSDSDISVLRYTGNSAPVMTGQSVAGLLSSGWELVGNYANVTPVSSNSKNITGTASINSSGLSSSWWLISAYSDGYGATASDPRSSTSGLDIGNDYVKVLTVAGSVAQPSKVPEPASGSLVAVAFVALAWVSRRSVRRGRATA